jgi:hypothetical protein
LASPQKQFFNRLAAWRANGGLSRPQADTLPQSSPGQSKLFFMGILHLLTKRVYEIDE